MLKVARTTYTIIIILCMTVFSIGSSFVYISNTIAYAADEKSNTLPTAEACIACTRSSPYLDRYIQFNNEIVYTLQKFANKESSIFTTGGDPTLTSSNNSNTEADLQRQLRAITDNLNKKRQMATSTTYVTFITSSEMVANARVSMGILTSSAALQRDWNKLEDAGGKLMNTATDLGNAGVFVRIGFKDGWRESIQNILKSYSTGTYPLFIYNENNSATSQPIKIFSDLWSMTQTLKFGLYSDTIFTKSETFSKTYMGGALNFSPVFLENMISYYTCIKGLAGVGICSTVSKVGNDGFSEIAKSTKEDANRAMLTFKTALKRLSGFWSKNDGTKQALKDRQYELLRGEYGRKAAKAGIIKQFTEGWKMATKSLVDTFTKTTDAVIQGITPSVRKNTPPVVIDDPQLRDLGQQEKEDLRTIGIETAKLANQGKAETEYNNPVYVTKLFPILTQNIIAQKVILDGKGNKNTIYENLGTACLNQCTNIPGKKCYYESGE